MAELSAVENFPENLKSCYQVPDDLFSTVCKRVIREQKNWTFLLYFSFFLVIFDPLLVAMAEVYRVVCARAYVLSSLCGFDAFICI